MHYIRFLKVPRVVAHGNGGKTLDAKITITTDLGESFFPSDIALLACLESKGPGGPGFKPQSFSWLGEKGMRALDISLRLPDRPLFSQMLGMSIHFHQTNLAPNDKHLISNFERVLVNEGGIVPVYSCALLYEPSKTTSGTAEALAERKFHTKTGTVSIWEETGESIARHIWDAGLVLSAYLSQLSPHILQNTSPPAPLPRLPTLENLLKRKYLNILELGAGCGIVGLILTHSLSANINRIILTDLPEASEILERNLAPFLASSDTSSKISHEVLDWSDPVLPENMANTAWDLVLIADCTYNPDVVPDLVATLGRVREGSERTEGKNEVLVLLAMKVRHESEKVFFELMDDAGWGIREKAMLGLGSFGGGVEDEGEEVEIYVFGEKELGRGKRRKVR